MAPFHLLETIPQYAATRLEGGGEDAAVHARHARRYLALVHDAEPHLITGERRHWVDLVVREMDNLRAVLSWTRAHESEWCLQLAGSLGWAWYSSGLWFEGRRWL